MADTATAVQFVLRQEDSRLSGEVTTLPGDRGGRTRFGLAERFHPDLTKSGYFDDTEYDKALTIAEQVYAEQYAGPLMLDGVQSQDVANRLLSFAINEGPPEAITLAQRACKSLGCSIADDGKMGPASLAALNSLDPLAWLAANRAQQEAFYRHLVTTQPKLLPELQGLLNRADA
jgi:type VI secretion system secreted protein VgrG